MFGCLLFGVIERRTTWFIVESCSCLWGMDKYTHSRWIRRGYLSPVYGRRTRNRCLFLYSVAISIYWRFLPEGFSIIFSRESDDGNTGSLTTSLEWFGYWGHIYWRAFGPTLTSLIAVFVLARWFYSGFRGDSCAGTHSLFGFVTVISTQFLLSLYIVGNPTIVGGREYAIHIELAPWSVYRWGCNLLLESL